MNNALEKLHDVFRETFEDPALDLRPDLTAADVERWDSLNHINLVVALEEAFNITFTTEEIAGMANVGDLVKVMRVKGVTIDLD